MLCMAAGWFYFAAENVTALSRGHSTRYETAVSLYYYGPPVAAVVAAVAWWLLLRPVFDAKRLALVATAFVVLAAQGLVLSIGSFGGWWLSNGNPTQGSFVTTSIIEIIGGVLVTIGFVALSWCLVRENLRGRESEAV